MYVAINTRPVIPIGIIPAPYCQTKKEPMASKKTEESLYRFGLEASFVPSEAYGKILFEEFIKSNKEKELTVLFPRAEVVNFEPETILKSAGFAYYPVVCYRTIANTIDSSAVSSFANEDSILFTAPSTVRSYQNQFGCPKAKVIAIGRSTASEMSEQSWGNFIIMENPDIEKVLEYI